MTVSVGLSRTFTVIGAANLDAETDQLMQELLRLEDDRLSDSAVGVNLARCEVEVEVVGTGETFDDAVAHADAAIRTAIHAVGGSTPDWTVVTLAQHAELVTA